MIHCRYLLRTILLLLSLQLMSLMCNSSNDISEQKNTVLSFYKTIITGKYYEIPDSSHINILKPYISDQFRKLLIEARITEDLRADNITEPVPPLIEGSLFTSLFEGPDTLLNIITDTITRNAFLVEFQHNIISDAPDKDSSTKWNDRIYLIEENGTWVIDDIKLLGNWDFARKGSVKNILHQVISTNKYE